MNRYFAIALAILTSANTFAQTQLTIPELVALQNERQKEGPLVLLRTLELVTDPPDILAKRADLILHGVINSSVTYLSDDQRDLFTDMKITPIRVVVQRNVSTSSTPGLPAPIIVKRWGGQAVIDGREVRQRNVDLRAFTVGEEVFLILFLDSSSQKYYLEGEVAGAFAVASGRLQNLLEHHPFYEQRDGIAVDQFVADLQEATGTIR